MVIRTLAILRMILSRISRRNKDFILWQGICYCGCTHSITSKLKNTSDNRSRSFINIQCLLILRLSVIAIRHCTADTFSVSHFCLEHCLDFLTGIFCIPLIHDIQKWCKIIICRIGTVNSVIYCNKTDIFLREHHFRIETYLQIVSAKSGHIFDDHCSHSAGFNLCQQRIECRSVEVRSWISIITEMLNITNAMLHCIIFQILLLVCYGVGFALHLIITGQTLVKCCYSIIFSHFLSSFHNAKK